MLLPLVAAYEPAWNVTAAAAVAQLNRQLPDCALERQLEAATTAHLLSGAIGPELIECRSSARGAYAFGITMMKMNYARKVVKAVERLRSVTSADLLIVLDVQAAEPVAVQYLEKQNAEIVKVRQPVPKSELPEAVATFADKEKNCCGFREFLKIVLWNLTQYDTIVSLDIDVTLLVPIDAIFDPRPGCGLVEDDFADALYSPGPGSPWNGGFFVARPKRRTYESMLHVLRTATFDVDGAWNGAGPGPCSPGIAGVAGLTPGQHYCHGMATLQGFLYYFFVQRSENTTVRKLPYCFFDYQGVQCRFCVQQYRHANTLPFTYHKIGASTELQPFFDFAHNEAARRHANLTLR